MADDQELDAEPTITTRFSNAYGKKPPVLYVKVDGNQIGYWDIGAEAAVLENPRHEQAAEHLATIESTAMAWNLRQAKRREKKARAAARNEAVTEKPTGAAHTDAAGSATTPTAPEALAPSPASPGASSRPSTADRGRDLSLNKAGDSARETARARFRQAPVVNLFKRLAGRTTGDDWSWRQGVRGEREVGRALDRAIAGRRGWLLLHGIKRNARGTDVDHLLIGPGGIFSINAKFHEGKRVWVGEHVVRVGQKSAGHIFEARTEARAVKKILDAAFPTPHPVTPVVVIAGSSTFSRAKSVPDDVVVLSVDEITGWLNTLGESLRPWEVEQIFGVARWERTWIAS